MVMRSRMECQKSRRAAELALLLARLPVSRYTDVESCPPSRPRVSHVQHFPHSGKENLLKEHRRRGNLIIDGKSNIGESSFEVVEPSTLRGQLQPGGLSEVSGLFSYLWRVYWHQENCNKNLFCPSACSRMRRAFPVSEGTGHVLREGTYVL